MNRPPHQAGWLPATLAAPIDARHSRVIVYMDIIFGSYCAALAGAACLAWWQGHGTIRTVIALLGFLAVNVAISQVSHRLARPVIAEAGRSIAGAVTAPLAYLATDAPFGMWWPGFMIMALSGAVFFGLVTGSAVPGRLISVYYASALFLVELLANPRPNWYAFSVGAGAILMVGFLLAEVVALLDRALDAERQQREALGREKLRSEQLLQKEAEVALRASEAHYRTLIEHSSDGVSIVDRAGRFRYLSPVAERILGYTAAMVAGHPFDTLVHPDDRERTMTEFAQQLTAPDGVRIVESRIVRPDGTVRALEIVGRLLPNGDVVGNLRDVTERQQMARAFRAVVQGTAASTGADFLTSLVGHLATALGVDHAFIAEVTGESPVQVRTIAFWSRGRIVPNIVYGLDGTPCERVIGGQLCFHASGVQEVYPADRDLVTLAADSYLGMPLRDGAGIVRGHVAVLDGGPMRHDPRSQEILAIFAARAGAELERQRAEEALRRLNNELEARVDERTAQLQAALDESSRLAAILEATPDIVGMAAIDGRTTYLNRAGRRRLGLADDASAADHHIADFYTPESFAHIAREGIPAALTHGSWSGEVVMRSLDGEEIPVSLAGTVHCDSDGQPRYISAIARDISESRRIAAELQAARDAAEAASRSKSTFLATMSHEIRTPMNAVIGMTDLLLTTPLTPRQRDFVDTIRTGGDALLGVINDILDFSKIEAGRLEFEHRPFNLRLALESAVELLAPRAADKGVELALSMDHALPVAVIGDATRVRQILVNLVSNGIKFTEQGEVVVSVAATGTAPDASQIELLLSVRDTGIGIPPEKRDRLFTSFTQLDTSTTREYGGTGLGLAISKRLAELMGGTIDVASTGVRGEGSVFTVTLRLGRALDQPPPCQQPSPELAGRRVLVVDDNATNRRILSLQLQSWGMLAVEAALPDEALDLLQRRDRFDLIVLDMQMPGMDGVALARRICSHRGGVRRLPIIMLTSFGRDLGVTMQSVPCFAGHLTKPVKASHLYDAIVEAIAGGGELRLECQDVSAPPTEGVSAASVVPLRILLAEDMEVNRKFALLALEELGFRADVAVNGAEVLRSIAEAAFDVVLMDVHMPEMDGLEATRRIRRELPADTQPYIIAMTANAMRGDRETCLDAGVDDYLSKPIYLAELRAALGRAIERITTSAPADAFPGRGSPPGPLLPRESVDTAVGTVRPDIARAAGAELLTLYLHEAAATIDRMRRACERGDRSAVREAAHGLKGTSGYVGAARMVSGSAAIERAARTEAPLDGAVTALSAELEQFRLAVANIVAGTDTGRTVSSHAEPAIAPAPDAASASPR